MYFKDFQEVHTHDIENEIWFHILNKLSNYTFVRNIVGKSERRIEKIVILTKQAQDFYEAYKQVSYITKPILLFYSLERLAALLLKIKMNNIRNTNHGVYYNVEENKIDIQTRGLFPNFHQTYSRDNFIIANRSSFLLEDLVNAGPITELDLNGLFLRENNELLLVRVKTSNGHKITIHELDREFLFMFALSSIARYHVVQWSQILQGKNDDIAINIQRYLDSIRLFFPILICSYILEKKLQFPFIPCTIYSLDDWDNKPVSLKTKP
jgi:hypothetical protein